MLDGIGRARDAVRDVRELRGGTLSFGMYGTASGFLIADLVGDFRKRYPDVRLRLIGQNSSQVADAVREGRLEAALVVLPVDDDGLSCGRSTARSWSSSAATRSGSQAR